MANPIGLEEVRPQQLVAVIGEVAMADIPAKMMTKMDAVWAFVRAHGITGTGHNVWLYRPRPDGRMDVEVGVQVAAPVAVEGDVVLRQTPGGTAAHTFHYGEYDALPGVYRAVFEWCAENGHALAGVNWEVYGDWHDDPAKRRTDVYCLVGARHMIVKPAKRQPAAPKRR